MSGTIKKLLIGASVVASVSAIATNAASAAVFRPSEIEFDTTNINTWLFTDPANLQMDSTGIGGVNRRVLNDFNNYGNITKATAALTDKDSATNVEIWTKGEAPTANVGFSANLGQNKIKLESVTATDWATGSLAEKWVDGYLGTYSGILQSLGLTPTADQKGSLVKTLKEKGMYSSGDPNVGDVTYNDQTRQLKVDLVGHLDRSMLYVDTNKYTLDLRTKITVNKQSVANPNYGKP
ncbi:MAG TPA: NF038130 family PEP-CTERM protein, partial [Phormidium sp.]